MTIWYQRQPTYTQNNSLHQVECRIIARHLFSQVQRFFDLAHRRLFLLFVAALIDTNVFLGQCILAMHLSSISRTSHLRVLGH